LGAYALFSLVFWPTAKHGEKLSRVWLMVSMIVELALVLLMINAICHGYDRALLVVVGSQLI